jgi:ornithine cyclodeaminase/alanine dehydrogenase-like protein (mu-crystallin family)
MARELGIEVTACDDPAEVYRGVDIMASCTDGGFAENRNPASAHLGRYLEPGTHVVSNYGPLDDDTVERVHRALVLGVATAPTDRPEIAKDHVLVYEPPEEHPAFREHKYWHRRYRELIGTSIGFPDESRVIYLPELLAGTKSGRTSPDQITFSERGNLQGAQFHAVAGRVYEACLARGLGREIPTDWLVEDERN